jgi:hypothetical protein
MLWNQYNNLIDFIERIKKLLYYFFDNKGAVYLNNINYLVICFTK